MDTIIRNTRFDNLVNYDCSTNSSISTKDVAVDSSDINSQASIIKNNIIVEYRTLFDVANVIL